MELLINEMVHLDADRALHGGGQGVRRAQLLAGFERLDVGAKNSEFVLDFLEGRSASAKAQDLLDVRLRKVYFFVDSGRCRSSA